MRIDTTSSPEGGRPVAPCLEFDLLGGFRLAVNGTLVVDLVASRLQSVLCYLALHHHSPLHRQRLAHLLWADTSESQARTNLRNILHKIRHDLPCVGQALYTDQQCVSWTPETSIRLDVEAFEAACVARDTQRATALYTGDLLPDCYDEWVLVKRNQLQVLFLSALASRIAQLEREQRYSCAVHDVHRYLAVDPLCEDVHRMLMRLLLALGDRAGALHAYRSLKQLLARELGVAPSWGTQQMLTNILKDGRPTSD